MDETHVVTVFVRDGGEVLLLRRSDEVGSSVGRWGAIAGHAEDGPDHTARAAICEEAGLASEAIALVRVGDPFQGTDSETERRRIVHPYLFDVATRDVTTTSETTAYEWVSPTELRRRETVPDLWRSYERVSPSLETIETDRERGSTALSVSALRVLRDQAGVLADRAQSASNGDSEADEPDIDGETNGDDGWDELASLARALRTARPSMAVIENRVNRAMATADGRSSRAVERAAQRAIARAADANGHAVSVAAEQVTHRESFASGEDSDGYGSGDGASASAGLRLVTLSRSGTVLETLRRLEPAPQGIVIAESRPGSEGIGVAERVASEYRVTLVADAAVASVLCEYEIDALVVGADTVYEDGSVLNKVGTRNAAIAAAYEGIPTYVVAASAKISTDSSVNADFEARDGSELYDVDGESAIDVWNPTFDLTPAEVVSGICTERGMLASSDVAAVAEEFAAFAVWDEQ